MQRNGRRLLTPKAVILSEACLRASAGTHSRRIPTANPAACDHAFGIAPGRAQLQSGRNVGEACPHAHRARRKAWKIVLTICCSSTTITVVSKPASPDARSGPALYNRIPVLRAERKLSRSELAEALDINTQTVGYIERGDFNPSLELAFRIGEFFRLPIEAIFSRRPFRPLSEELYGKHAASQRNGAK
jgi:putative transcriptional regulator